MTEFTADWFEQNAEASWAQVFSKEVPKRVLEIGSYEGRATCWLLEHGVQHITCIDTWKGGAEHTGIDFDAIYERFQKNVREVKQPTQSVQVKIGRSDEMMARMIAGKTEPFEFVYLDGSHTAADVLSDACFAWRLTKPGGIICFDDVTWNIGIGFMPFDSPRMAIEAFLQCYWPWLTIFQDRRQLWVRRHQP